jgi:hypothetical protein
MFITETVVAWVEANEMTVAKTALAFADLATVKNTTSRAQFLQS